MTYIETLIKDNGGKERATFGDIRVLRVAKDKVTQEDMDKFQLSGEVDVLIMIPQKDTKTKSGKEWKKGMYLILDVRE